MLVAPSYLLKKEIGGIKINAIKLIVLKFLINFKNQFLNDLKRAIDIDIDIYIDD